MTNHTTSSIWAANPAGAFAEATAAAGRNSAARNKRNRGKARHRVRAPSPHAALVLISIFAVTFLGLIAASIV